MVNHDKNTDTTEYPITVEQLRLGVFIRITGLSWVDHPFAMSSFKINDKEQLKTLRQLGLKSVVFVPSKSDVFPLPVLVISEPKPQAAPVKDVDTERLLIEKHKRIEQQKLQRKKIIACEKKFAASVKTVKNVMRNIEGGRLDSIKDADDLLQALINDLLIEKDSAVQLMNAAGGESIFYHSLNVSVLALMLGREHGLGAEALRVLGLSALFHDIGKHRVPKNVLFKPTPLTKFETDILKLHPRYGVETMQPLADTGDFPSAALSIIRDHHERVDGSGYPSSLTGEWLSDMTKIVSIVDRYDNLCNNHDPSKSITPHEALAYMFSREKTKFDMLILQRFIAYLGVYPPGTLVRLDNEAVGLVLSVNPKRSLRPTLLIYDPSIPKNEALIFDLAEDSTISIASSIRPRDLPVEIFDYLTPRTRVSYFLTADESKPASPAPVSRKQ